MATVGMILFFLVGPALGLLGLVKPSLFHRGGWKPSRLKLLGVGIGVSVGGFVLTGINLDQLRPKEPVSASSTTAKDTAPLPAPASAATTQPDVAPPPVAAAKAPAVSERALPGFCTYTQRSAEITKESQRRFSDIAKADEWAEQKVKKLSAQLVQEVGVSFPALLAHATANRWRQKCNAMQAGKPALDAAEVSAATASDAASAKDALEGYYVFRLNSEAYPLFDRSLYSAILCGSEAIGGRRFVGCQPMGLGKRGLMGVYVVGRAADGSVQVAPVNGTAMTHIAEMPHLELGDRRLPVAAYVGSAIDIPAVINTLD